MSWDWIEPRDGDRQTQRLAGALAFIASSSIAPAQGAVELMQGTPMTFLASSPDDHTSVVHMIIIPIILAIAAYAALKIPLRYFGPMIMLFGVAGIVNSTSLGIQGGFITSRHATYYILASVTISYLFRTPVSMIFALFASTLAFITCYVNGGPHSGTINGIMTITVILTITLSLSMTADSYTRSYNELKRHAETDALTGLATRHVMERFAQTALNVGAKASSEHPSLGMVSLDLDDFKSINDAHGHRAGDVVLLRVAATIQRALPRGGLAVRLGGDEFAMLIPQASDTDMAALAAHVTEQIEGRRVTIPDTDVVLTPRVSTGWATVWAPQTFAELYTASDESLYQVKRERRQRRLAEKSPDVTYQGSA